MAPRILPLRSPWFAFEIAILSLCMATHSHAIDTLAAPHSAIPADIIGTWEVAKVYVDTGATRTLLYRPDDFRLTGRVFQISSRSITSNTPERQDCQSPGIAASLPVEKLIEASMARRTVAPVAPTAEDYQLRLPKNPKAAAFTVTCNGKPWGINLGHEGGIQGAWVLRTETGRLAVRWYDETVLELKRVPDGARPDPSFDCRKASTGSERTICGSVPLSRLDVSVARSFAAAAHEMREAGLQKSLATLKEEQRAWLVQRNRCKSNAACLEQAMSSRLESIELMPRED
ncbi:lysozyme inhibitor LprI family protein [Noviherbaspirillum aerium]|uniref:lysozyme inhibitor LprI family protein n=1 Tax=Noviherbaspirillum aerium TaxID=2588497 RepID=UPI00124E235B|nr:hypothetical protein [Noviherbaspirillum aerium]